MLKLRITEISNSLKFNIMKLLCWTVNILTVIYGIGDGLVGFGLVPVEWFEIFAGAVAVFNMVLMQLGTDLKVEVEQE